MDWRRSSSLTTEDVKQALTPPIYPPKQLIYLVYKIGFKNYSRGPWHGKIYLLLDILYYIFPKRYKIFRENIKPIDFKESNIIKIKAKIFFQTKECENLSAQIQQRRGKVITMFYNMFYSILF